jgi:hypothetical protein
MAQRDLSITQRVQKFMALAATVVFGPPKWLMDTGCAYDLISSNLAKDGPVRSAELVSSTANGKIKADTIAPLT